MERLGLINPGRVENALSRSQSGRGRAVQEDPARPPETGGG